VSRFVWGLLFFLAGCSGPQMKLELERTPKAFAAPASAERLEIQGVSILRLDPSPDSAEHWNKLWRQGLTERLSQFYWVGEPSDEDYWVVDQLFFRQLTAFYLWFDQPVNKALLDQSLCPSLNPKELLWLTQRWQEEISTLRLDMLLTTYLEQTLIGGASPVYSARVETDPRTTAIQPSVLALKGEKFSGKTTLVQGQGLWICRKTEVN